MSYDNILRSLTNEKEDLKNIHEEYEIKDKGYLQWYKEIKKNSSITLYFLDACCDF